MRKAFTLIELLVVIAITAILVTILVPMFISPCARSERTVCQNNLGVIGRKYNDYAYNSKTFADPFLRHIDDGDAHDTTAATGLKTADTLDAAIGTCGMQAVWVLIDRGYLPESAFKCPGDAGYTARTSDQKYGWSALTEFSYGVHYPYASDGAGTANPADPNAKDVAGRLVYREDLVLFADRNPGGAVDGTTRFHSNHGGEDGGMLVVTRVGNTMFYDQETSSMAGFGDDIYTDAVPLATAAAFPQNRSDTVISPTVSRP